MKTKTPRRSISDAVRFTALAAHVMLGLSACEATVPAQELPELTYQHLGAIELDVGAIDISSNYRAPMAAPNVEHNFPTPPEKALRRWATDRLMAAGPGGLARFVIIDASIRETSLEQKKGLAGAFTKEQSERYEASVEATLEVVSDGETWRGFVTAKASRSLTVREDATVNDREQAWFSMTEALMRDFDREMESNIRRHLAAWIR